MTLSSSRLSKAGAGFGGTTVAPPFLVVPIRETPAGLRRSPGVVAVIVTSVTIVGLGRVWPSVTETLRWSPGGFAAGEVWRIASYVFPHADGWPHVTVNMVLLALFGWQLERVVGTRRFLLAYLGSGAAGMALLFPFDSHERNDMNAGASLAVFGVLAALTAWHAVTGGWRGPAIAWAVPTCLVVLLATGALAMVGHDGANLATGWESLWHHAMGMVAGVLLGILVSGAGVAPRALAASVTVVGFVGGLAVGVLRWT